MLSVCLMFSSCINSWIFTNLGVNIVFLEASQISIFLQPVIKTLHTRELLMY
jgi:hypothetical protein